MKKKIFKFLNPIINFEELKFRSLQKKNSYQHARFLFYNYYIDIITQSNPSK